MIKRFSAYVQGLMKNLCGLRLGKDMVALFFVTSLLVVVLPLVLIVFFLQGGKGLYVGDYHKLLS